MHQEVVALKTQSVGGSVKFMPNQVCPTQNRYRSHMKYQIVRPPLAKTFWLPSRRDLFKIKISNEVKLIFRVSDENPERMWVIVTKQQSIEQWTGTIDNDAFGVKTRKALPLGKEVIFHPLDIIQILEQKQGQSIKNKRRRRPLVKGVNRIKFGQVWKLVKDFPIREKWSVQRGCVIPKGRRVVVLNDPVSGASVFGVLILNSKGLSGKLVPNLKQIYQRKEGFAVLVDIRRFLKYFVKDKNRKIIFDHADSRKFWKDIVKPRGQRWEFWIRSISNIQNKGRSPSKGTG